MGAKYRIMEIKIHLVHSVHRILNSRVTFVFTFKTFVLWFLLEMIGTAMDTRLNKKKKTLEPQQREKRAHKLNEDFFYLS